MGKALASTGFRVPVGALLAVMDDKAKLPIGEVFRCSAETQIVVVVSSTLAHYLKVTDAQFIGRSFSLLFSIY